MSAPTKFVIKIGGFFGPNYEVGWHRRRLWYRNDHLQLEISPSREDWRAFWTRLDQIGVWNWRKRYDDPDVLDGTQWSLDISDGVRTLQCFGSNRYPENLATKGSSPFKQFLKAVEALIRQPFGVK
jgi:hypothetical protein